MQREGDSHVPLSEFERIYREEGRFVWRTLRRMGIRDADLEDGCQQVFLVVHRKLSTFDQRSTIRTWLFGISSRVASDFRRRAHVRREVPSEQPCLTEVVAPDQPMELEQSLARKKLDELLDELDEKHRAVFVLAELEQLSMNEVAKILGCPLQTAYSRRRTARQRLEKAAQKMLAKEQRSADRGCDR